MNQKPPAINIHPGKRCDGTIVIIKGLFFSDNLFDLKLDYLEKRTCVTVNLHHYLQAECKDIDTIARRLCDDLDDLNISDALFISVGVGSAVAFKIAMLRTDLIRGNIMVGFSNKLVDASLRKIQYDIFQFAMQQGFDDESRSLVVQTLIGCASNCQLIDQEIKLMIKMGRCQSFLTLLNLQQEQHFSREEIKGNKVPNFIITANSDPWASANDVHNLSKEMGTNRGFMKINKNISNTQALTTKEYNIVLEVILDELSMIKQETQVKVS
ncbi:MAG: hypothetical protein AAFQ94_05525 [Bacteroidota bacterium]